MMRRLAERPGLVFALVFAWKLALLVFTAQPVPANDAFFYDGPVVNFLLHGRFTNPSLALALPISGNEIFSAYPPLYHLVLLGWMSAFGVSALSAMWLHLLLFGLYEILVLAIFRRLRTPAVCVHLAGLFLLSITFHDRPDSLAHVFGLATIYGWICARPRDGARVVDGAGSRWQWGAVSFAVLTLGTSLQIGAFYLLFLWLGWGAGRMFFKERLPVAPMAASILIPFVMFLLVKFVFPHLWSGFQEHARLTPSATGLRMPQTLDVLKIIRTVPGVLAVAALLPLTFKSRQGGESTETIRARLIAGVATVTALTVIAASLCAFTANMVQVANYLQPLVVGGFLASLLASNAIARLPRKAAILFAGLALLAAVRAVGLTTWGVACAADVGHDAALERVRRELDSTPPDAAVVVSSAYLYETARRESLRWIHSDWPGRPDFSSARWEMEGLMKLKPAKILITQFDYFRRYDSILAALQAQPDVVEVRVENTAGVPAPDSIPALRKVVQHVSWAPVVVSLRWN